MDRIVWSREGEGFSREGFEKGNALLQPAYTWTWNGPVTETETDRQLDRIAEAGIRCVYVLPMPRDFRPYTKELHLEPEYLSEAYFRAVRSMAEKALRRGIQVWLYDEGGWPSGSACGHVRAKRPELCRKSLAAREIGLAAGEAYLPGERTLAAFEGRRMVRPGERAERDTKLTEYYVRWEEGLTVDSLDEDLGREFVAMTHEGYARHLSGLFGTRDASGRWIPGSGKIQIMFTDEPGAGRFPWPRGFEDRFRARFGYDILPYLPDLMNLSEEAEGEALQARMDWRQLTGEMFRDGYFVPVHDWCRRNHVLSGGHLDMDHVTDGCLYHSLGSVLPLLREMDVPGVDVIWRQIALPGKDRRPCAEGNGFFPRFASSAAAQSGGKLALSESLAVYGSGCTGDEARFVMDFQLVRGVNLFNFMHMPYCREKAAALVERPVFIPEMPGWEHLRARNDYAERACWLMQLGLPGEDTALYFPARDIWAGGRTCRDAVRAFDAAGQALEALQADFDIIDDEGLRLARKEGGTLCLGLARYRHVVVPDCRHMPGDVRDILEGVDGTAAPALACGCPDIRVRTRLLPDGGRIWMLLNESAEEVTVRPAFPCASVCRIDADGGRLIRLDLSRELTLASGASVFLLGGTTPPDRAEAPGRRVFLTEAEDFSLRAVRQALVTPEGIREVRPGGHEIPCRTGGWAEYLGGDFSGEAVYTVRCTLPDTPSPGERYEINLGRVEVSARVFVNGACAGTAWRHPMRVAFDGSLFGGKKDFVLEIETANTLVNQIERMPMDRYFTPDERGPYQERHAPFEREAPRGGLYGPVRLYRLDGT